MTRPRSEPVHPITGAPLFARSHAVIIGIDRYQAPVPPLRTAGNDARRLAELLERSHGYTVTTRLDEAASGAAITQLVAETLPAQVGPDDRVLFYFAGHGIATNGDDGPAGFLLPCDARVNDVSSFLYMPWLHDALTALPCRHLLVVLDACFAGAFRWSAMRGVVIDNGEVHLERFERFVRDPAWQVITSASADQTALDQLPTRRAGQLSVEALGQRDGGQGDDGMAHSPFALALFEALDGAADLIPRDQGDGLVTATELFLYLQDVLQTRTIAAGQRQTPSYWGLRKHGNGEYVFLVPDVPLTVAPAPPLDLAGNPWRGLQSYDLADRELFFGRAAQIDALDAHVQAHPLTIVLGASGSGKSSVVKAGLAPRLVDAGWTLLPTVRPGPSPLRTLWHAVEAPAVTDTALHAVLGRETTTTLAARIVDAIRTRLASPSARLAVVIDQAEELVTLAHDDVERDAFLSLLAALVDAHPDQLRVILTLRSDFEPSLDRRVFGARWRTGRVLLAPMTRDELRAVIEQPASRRVLFFEPPALVEQLLDDVVATPGALPLLSVALSETYIRYVHRQDAARTAGERCERAITADDLDAVGGVMGAITSRAEAEYAALDATSQGTMQRLLLRMVTTDAGALARRRVNRADLMFAEPEEQQRVTDVVQRLIEARLLVAGEADEGSFLEPAHDALVRGWGRLVEWIRQAASDDMPLVTRQKLARAASEWVATDGPARAGLLWSDGVRSAQLRTELARTTPWLTVRERQFAERSVRRGRVQRALWMMATAAIAVAGTIAVWQGVEARRSAREANAQVARGYLLEAMDSTLDARMVAANLAAAVAVAPDPRAASSGLLHQLARLSAPGFEIAHGPRLQAAEWSPRGDFFVTRGGDSTARLWSARTGDPIGPALQHRAEVTSAVISGDGREVLTAASDGTVSLWDAQTGARRRVFGPLATAVAAAALSPDGSRVLVTDDKGATRLWDARTGAELAAHGAPPVRYGTPTTRSVLSTRLDQRDARVVLRAELNAAIVIDAIAGTLVHTLRFPYTQNYLNVAEFSPDGTRLVVASTDGTAAVYDAKSWRRITPPLQHAGPIVSAHFDAVGQRVVTASEDGTARIWSATSGAPIGAAIQHDNAVLDARFSPDGRLLATASADSSVGVWDVATRAAIGARRRHLGEVRFVSFRPDGRALLAGGEWIRERRTFGSMSSLYAEDRPRSPAVAGPDPDRLLRVWSISQAQQEQPAALDRVVGYGSQSGSLLRLRLDGAIETWSLPAGMRARAVVRDSAWLMSASGAQIHLTPDASRLLLVSASGGGLYDAATGRLISRLPGSDSTVMSDDGRAAAFRDEATGRWTLVDVVTGQQRASLVDSTAMALWFVPRSDQLVALRADRGVEWRSRETGAVVRTRSPIPAMGYVSAVALSPDGRRLLTARGVDSSIVWDTHDEEAEGRAAPFQRVTFSARGRYAGLLRISSLNQLIWDAQLTDLHAGRSIGALAHGGDVSAVAFAPAETLVATASADRTARVWDARTALPTTQPLRHAQAVEDVTFTADGTRLITGSPGRFTLWDVADGARLSEFVADGSVMTRVPVEDSTRLVLSAEDGRVAVWDIRAVAPANRADLVDLAELIIGGRMRGPRDFVADVPNRFARLAVWRRRAAAWANAPAGSFEEWVHWYFADPDTRPAQPGWRGAAAPR